VQPAGAEFFRRRLQRAAAIPPEQRDPAVHAFVTSVQLMRAADELLPLTADGQPALPAHTLAGQQAEVQAFLLAATAYHMAPEMLEWEGQQPGRSGRYCERRFSLAGGSCEAAYPPSLQPLGGLLLKQLFAQSAVSTEQSFLVASAAAQEARSARSTISRQLQQLQRSSGQQLLMAEELEAALHRIAILSASDVLEAYHRQQLPLGESMSVAEAAAASSERLLALEPQSPKALQAASAGFICSAISSSSSGSSSSAAQAAMRRGLGCLIAAFRAAEVAHSPYWKARVAPQAVTFAAAPLVPVSTSDLAALIAAVEEAPANVKQLRRVLPHSWVTILQEAAEAAQFVLPAARLRLQGSTSSTGDEQLAVVTAAAKQQVAATEHLAEDAGCACSGCGKRALGLRRCARCKQAACEWGTSGAGTVCYLCWADAG